MKKTIALAALFALALSLSTPAFARNHKKHRKHRNHHTTTRVRSKSHTM